MSKWRKVKVGDVCDLIKGETGIAKATPGKYPLVSTGAGRKTCNTYQLNAKAVCIPLVSSTGHGKKTLNHVHYQEGKFALGTILVAVIPKDDNILSAQFLYLYLSHLKDLLLVPLMRGAANVSLPIKAIKSVEIPLPEINTQRKIVTKFNGIDFVRSDLSVEITRRQTLLKKLRQSILQEAVQGKLTKDWREKNPEIEPASKLLERIREEKEKLIKEKKIRKQKPLPPIKDNEVPFDLPDGWEWCRLGEISNVITSGSRGWAKYYSSSGAKFIRMGNLSKKTFKMRLKKIQYVTPPQNCEGARTKLIGNDILISITGDVGSLGLIPKDFGEAYINQHTGMIRLNKRIASKCIAHFLLSPHCQIQCNAPQRGIKNSFRLTDIQNILIALPSYSEQKAIVAKVEKLLSYCDQLERQINQSQKNSGRLMQTVLKEAFNGGSDT